MNTTQPVVINPSNGEAIIAPPQSQPRRVVRRVSRPDEVNAAGGGRRIEYVVAEIEDAPNFAAVQSILTDYRNATGGEQRRRQSIITQVAVGDVVIRPSGLNTVVNLTPTQVLGDLSFEARPRRRCVADRHNHQGGDRCPRYTRRVCNSCRNCLVCMECGVCNPCEERRAERSRVERGEAAPIVSSLAEALDNANDALEGARNELIHAQIVAETVAEEEANDALNNDNTIRYNRRDFDEHMEAFTHTVSTLNTIRSHTVLPHWRNLTVISGNPTPIVVPEADRRVATVTPE